MRNYYRFTDNELRDMLRMRGLPQFGGRQELINRLGGRLPWACRSPESRRPAADLLAGGGLRRPG